MRLALLLLLTACAPDVAKDKAAATVTEPAPKVEAPSTPAPAAAPGSRPVDPARSSIQALGAKITKQHVISFPTFTGSISAQDQTVAGVEFTVQMADLTTDAEKLVTHLKSPDFFDVAQFPTAHFVSSSVVAGEGNNHTVTGQLTLHGVTKEISFPATIEVLGNGDIKGRAEFSIDRKDFGVVYPGKPDDLIQDKVVLTVEMVATMAV